MRVDDQVQFEQAGHGISGHLSSHNVLLLWGIWRHATGPLDSQCLLLEDLGIAFQPRCNLCLHVQKG